MVSTKGNNNAEALPQKEETTMTAKIKIEIRSNEGYTAEQVTERHNTMTVGELRKQLEDYEDDTEIVTFDLNNERGASWGLISAGQWIESVPEDEEDEEA